MHGILRDYAARFARSRSLAEKARALQPDGVSSDSRVVEPFPVFVDRADGATKWTVEGQPLIDLWAGHGALLFGHRPPAVEAAIGRRLERGTHFAACHPLELEWAERINRMVPSAERVRFTNSGTEAVLLAVHIARLATGRRTLLRFGGHYHGWHASINVGSGEAARGGSTAVDHGVEVLPLAEPDALRARLSSGHDVAAVILEPTGPCSGVVPLPVDTLVRVGQITREAGAALIFDEIVTGFRVAPGGAQAARGVTPDMTTLAKVMCGGLPGGALVGGARWLDLLSKRRPFGDLRIPHLGTYNGSPLSAAAGIATLDALADGEVHWRIDAVAGALKRRLNRLFAEHNLDWAIYGSGSCLKLLIGHGLPVSAEAFDPTLVAPAVLLARGRIETWRALRLALLLEGVDASLSSFVTAACDEATVDAIVHAFASAIRRLGRDDCFGMPSTI